jgi:cell division protein ZipA
MEDNFRNVLIILSAIAITAIFIHGLWTIRKQKNPYKLMASKDKVSPIKRDFDGKGFDQDGVGQVKVKITSESTEIKNTEMNISEQLSASNIDSSDNLSDSQLIIKKDILGSLSSDISYNQIASQTNPQELDNSIDNEWFKEANEENQNQDKFTIKSELVSTESQDLVTKTKKSQPLYAQPVTQAKPSRPVTSKSHHQQLTAGLKRNQLEIDFSNEQPNDNKIKSTNTDENNKKRLKKIVEVEPQVIVLSVVMPANQQMLGAVLLPTLLTLGLKYGEMNIFHRHEDNAGKGKVTFSLANIMNPGSFDLDSIETFATRGVSLFMTLPNASDPFYVFEQMLNAAKQLAQEFNAQVLDEKRNILTKQTEQHYLHTIREFERISRITSMS